MTRVRWRPVLAVGGLAAVAAAVVGGLAWVSVFALQEEAARRTAVARADAVNRERLALWRLDSHMLSPLGLENNRPFTHYSAMAAQAAVVVDDTGTPIPNPGRSPSPLLSADLPGWMALHFQLDAPDGWHSPQVLPTLVYSAYQSDPLALSLSNCTPDRKSRLDDLRGRFPTDAALRALAEQDVHDGGELFVVPVPQSDDPAGVKPPPRPDDGPLARYRGFDLDPAALRYEAQLSELYLYRDHASARGLCVDPVPAARPVEPAAAGATAVKSRMDVPTPPAASRPVPAPAVTALDKTVELKQLPNTAEPPEGGDRRGTFNKLYSARGGYDVQVNGAKPTGEQKAAAPFVREGAKGDPKELAKQADDDAVRLTDANAHSKAGEKAVPPPAAPQSPLQNVTEWTDRLAQSLVAKSKDAARKSESDVDRPAGYGRGGLPTDDLRAKGQEDMKKADGKRGANTGRGRTASAELFVCEAKVPAAIDASVCEAKPAPVVTPVVMRLGTLRPRWLTAADGTTHLLLVRTAIVGPATVYQGVLVDWPRLKAELIPLVTDLFPNADLRPVRDDADAAPEQTMTAVPLRLDTQAEPPPPPGEWTPLRFGLVIAWAAAVLAIVAVAVGGRAVLVTSERRVRFASAVTHELRTPLTALQLHLDLLNSGLVTDEAKKAEYLATIAAEADRLNRLVGNVLDFARLEKSSALAHARPVPVADLLSAVRFSWADRLAADGFELVTHAETPDGRTVTVDPRVMEQVLGNLIDNARKYAMAAADRRIRVGVRATTAGRVVFEVCDGGPGVPPAERRSIFRPFTRGSGSTDTGGAGLGLALARQWAALYRGSLTYHDTPCGACFRLELPAA